MVICHLGNGVTVAAVQGGRSVDTSLGFSPLEGAMMGSRCGDLDPGVVLYMQREVGMRLDEVDEMLHHKSGLIGVSGQSNDMRRLVKLADDGDERSALAVEMFTYRLKKYIGAYAAAIGGIDLLVFTGGIGENSPIVRTQILKDMEFMGIELDQSRNAGACQDDIIISRQGVQVTVAVVHTKEELMIAREALDLIHGDDAKPEMHAGC
jgi:acetate kinase